MNLKSKQAQELEARLRVLLPESYQVFDEEVQPRSMGSAGLKYDREGRVLWDQMWGSFCDLAMAGGPPHRGTLLEPPYHSRAAMQTPAYERVSSEICRGLSMVTGLCAEASLHPGWVRLYCTSAAMSGWLMRAIVMENISASGLGLVLHLPIGPEFRVEKEVKNVITAAAKTCHYWQDHMSEVKHEEVAELLAKMQREAPLIQPDLTRQGEIGASEVPAKCLAEAIHNATGLDRSNHEYLGWLGLDCHDSRAAIWMMRALVASNVLSRCEGTAVFLPVNPTVDPGGEQSIRAVVQAHQLARGYQMMV